MKRFKDIINTYIYPVISGTEARELSRSNAFLSSKPFTVIYTGHDSGYLLFRIIVNAADANGAFLEVSDKSKGEIYSEIIPSASKVQGLKIEKKDRQELDFKLMMGKAVYSRSFSIL